MNEKKHQSPEVNVDMERIKTLVPQMWESRRKMLHLDKTKTGTIELQLQFYIGAIGILDAIRNDGSSCIPPEVYIKGIRGQYLE